jgi:uncharacterized phage protein (TIGR01671 family)
MYDVTELMWSNETAYIAEIGNPDNAETIDLDKIELMQLTGLKDKNGKEIYEGDIMQRPPKVVMRAKSGEHTFTYKPFVIEWGAIDGEQGRYGWGWPSGLEHLKVIGNIYENLDLLQ